MCCRWTKHLLCFAEQEEEDVETQEARTSSTGCCGRRAPGKISPEMEGTIKQGEVYNFRGGTLNSDWKKSFAVLSKTETEAPLLYLYKDRPGGRIKHEVLLPAVAHEIRFGKSCQLYGKFSRKIPDLKAKLPRMVAIPERYCDRADPYIIWLWFTEDKDFADWRKSLAESLSESRLEAPRLEVLSEEGKKLCSGNNLSEWELYWIMLDKV